MQPRLAPPRQIRFPHEGLPFLDELYQSHEPADASLGAYFLPSRTRMGSIMRIHASHAVRGFLRISAWAQDASYWGPVFLSSPCAMSTEAFHAASPLVVVTDLRRLEV